MSRFKSEFLKLMDARGVIHQCTDFDALDACLAAGSITAYLGFDCTATSLHAGSLVPIMTARRLQQTGHRPIILMGGGTSKIGDPSFEDDARPLMTDEVIAENMAGIKKVFDQYVTFGDADNEAVMVNNADWLDEINYMDFLRDYGQHFSVNRMLSMDSVKLRLDREQSLTFLEFNYMVLQAYDFVELNRKYGCILQCGGSDQWGNIVNGVELGRRIDGSQLFGLTNPLLATASGQKMSKTVSGAVWLNDDMLPVYDFWQYWRNTEDADVGRFMRIFTDMPIDEIEKLEALEGAELNDAKKTLATEITTLAHGREKAEAAAETARKAFEEGVAGGDLPHIPISGAANIVDVVVQSGFAKSKGEARRLIKQGGVKLDDVAVTGEDQTVEAGGDGVKLSVGKKRHALIVQG